MLSVIQDLRLRAKLILLLLIPSLGILIFLGPLVSERYVLVRQMQAVDSLARLNGRLSDMVHEVQKERGRTGLYYGSDGKQFRQELGEQRALTNTRADAVQTFLASFDRAAYGPAFGAKVDDVSQRLRELPAQRQRVDTLAVPSKAALDDYTALIRSSLDLSSMVANVSSSSEVARLVSTNVAFAQAKESTGLERATLSNAFAGRKFAPGQYEAFIALRSSQSTYLGTFAQSATPEQVAAYKNTVQGSAVDTVTQLEQVAMDRAREETLGDVNAGAWFEQMTTKIDLMHKVEDRLAGDVVAAAGRLGQEAWTSLLWATGFGAGVLLLTIVGSAIMIRSLVRPVQQLTRAAAGLACGDIEQHIEMTRKDEIGQLAHAFGQTVGYLTQMAEAAQAIAGGDLTLKIEPRSEQDLLGTAFARMTAGLHTSIGRVGVAADGLAQTSRQLGTVADQVKDVVQQVAIAIQQIAVNAEDESAAAQASNASVARLNNSIEQVSRGASDQTRSVSEVSVTTERIATGVEQVAANANTLAAASQQTQESAEQGALAVRRTVSGMAEIHQVVSRASVKVEELGRLGEKIGAVVETIDDIAEQTNLLALNAAIEAARAGEHGRGFAVVADEVRKLAERSQRETKSISDLIREVQAGTRDAVAAMAEGTTKVNEGSAEADQAGRALEAILNGMHGTVQQVDQIAKAVQEMAARSREVSETMTLITATAEETTAASEAIVGASYEVGQSIQSITAGSAQNSAATEEVSAAAEEMSAQIEQMSDQSQALATTAEQLKDLVSHFVLDDERQTTDVLARRRAEDWGVRREAGSAQRAG